MTQERVLTLDELNQVRKQNDDYRDRIGNSELELALPALPSVNDEFEFDLLPVSYQAYGSIVAGSFARIRTTWLGAFPTFFSNLKWRTSDWGGVECYHIVDDESLDSLGSAYAAELSNFNTESLFQISPITLERLRSYYTEIGLMNPSGNSPFTPVAERIARRLRIPSEGMSSFRIVKGAVEKRFPPSLSRNSDDEIPF